MISYYRRYLSGEYKAVWGELIALGEKVRDEPLYDDARAIAQETVRRAKYNIELLYARLLDLGYEFEKPAAAFVLAGNDTLDRIAEIEERLGTLPILMHVWYETFASVNFCQAISQLRSPTGADVNGLGSHPQLIVQSLDVCWTTWLEKKKSYAEGCERDAELAKSRPELYGWLANRERRPYKRFLPTGGVASNCESVGLELPNLDCDGVMFDDGGGEFYFNDLLRYCFQWGGFPFCKYYIKGNKPLPGGVAPKH